MRGGALRRLGRTARLFLRARAEARFPFADEATIRRAQAGRLRSIAAFAHRRVPWYRAAMEAAGIDPADLSSAEDLARLPLVGRDDLQRRPLDFLPDGRVSDRFMQVRTGGSTGAPRTIHHTPESALANAAHGERERTIVARLAGRWTGYDEVVVVSPFAAAREIHGTVRGRTLVPRRWRIHRHFLSILDEPAEIAEKIDAIEPAVLHGFGSYLGRLFRYLDGTGREMHRPRVVTYSSDGMTAAERRLIEERFGIPVLGAYQAIEAFKIGFECGESEGVHMNVDLYPVRVIDEEGRELPPGEVGSVVVSNLVNRGTVLLNYRLGDLAARLPGPCPCGRNLPRLTMPVGREDDWVVLPSGREMHPQAVRTLFTDEKDVWRYRVVQEPGSRFSVEVVAAPAIDRRAVARRLERKFAERFGPEVAVDVEFVDAIETTPGGKTRVFTRRAG